MERRLRLVCGGLLIALGAISCGGGDPISPEAASLEDSVDEGLGTSSDPSETDGETGTAGSEAAPPPNGEGETSERAGDGSRAAPPPVRSTSPERDTSPDRETPTRPGAPWDIEAFEEYLYEPLTNVDFAIAERCGSAGGGPQCLVLSWQPRPVPQDLRDDCGADAFGFDPPGRQVETGFGEVATMYQRGTRVSISVFCVAAFDSLVGRTVEDFYAGFYDLCIGPCAISPQVDTGGVVDETQQLACQVTELAYTPPPVTEGWHHPVVLHDTELRVATTCSR